MIRAVPPEINGTVRIWIEWFGRSFAATACFVGWRWWIVLNMGLSRSDISPENRIGVRKRFFIQAARLLPPVLPYLSNDERTAFTIQQVSIYRLLIQINYADKRAYYELEAAHNNWAGRELVRQINSGLCERLLLSNGKSAVPKVARRERIPESPAEIIKEPMELEFLELKPDATYYEKDLESALITNLQAFLLELGNEFSFVARQKRITLENDEFFMIWCFMKIVALFCHYRPLMLCTT